MELRSVGIIILYIIINVQYKCFRSSNQVSGWGWDYCMFCVLLFMFCGLVSCCERCVLVLVVKGGFMLLDECAGTEN